ncbi:alpha/beta hydrolase [Aridibaculum aurantiacum]|uniref:alpha/beta hydrolase n=1 Tax=Aridibaculum aurantiacum TaxID=2810307 RepID=UPI001A958C63|nr:alpha/beta fold hydrolase [Aridibaculum aurantiacum]
MKTSIQTSRKKKKFLRWAKIGLLVYCLVGVAVYHLQEKFLFHPKALAANAPFDFNAPHTEVNIPVDATTNYHLVQFTTNQPAKGVLLYFHGNMKNVNHYASAATNMTNDGYEVWMIDYPGFGKSTGELTEEAMYQQALQVYKLARTKYKPSDIVIYGRSLGSGVASQLASIRDCKRLILETPYYSLTSVAARYFWMYPLDQMIRYKFPTNEYLAKVTAPVTIFHGTADGVIPYSNAQRLKEVLKQQDEFITIEGGSHNDLHRFDQLNVKLHKLLEESPSLTSTSL